MDRTYSLEATLVMPGQLEQELFTRCPSKNKSVEKIVVRISNLENTLCFFVN